MVDTEKLNKILEDKLRNTSREDWLALYDEYSAKKSANEKVFGEMRSYIKTAFEQICVAVGLDHIPLYEDYPNRPCYVLDKDNDILYFYQILSDKKSLVTKPGMKGHEEKILAYKLCKQILIEFENIKNNNSNINLL